MKVGVKNLKIVDSQAWTLMREGEAEKQVLTLFLFCYGFFFFLYVF